MRMISVQFQGNFEFTKCAVSLMLVLEGGLYHFRDLIFKVFYVHAKISAVCRAVISFLVTGLQGDSDFLSREERFPKNGFDLHETYLSAYDLFDKIGFAWPAWISTDIL